MPITPTTPIEVPATAAKVYDKYWLKSLQIIAPATTERVMMRATLTPYVSTTGEMAERSREVTIMDQDLFALAATTPEVTTAMEAVLHALEVVAKAQGRI